MRLISKNIFQFLGGTALVLALSCGVKHSGAGGGTPAHGEADDTAGDPASSDPAPVDAAAEAAKAETEAKTLALVLQAGVRNFAQINATMSVLTGVSPSVAAVKAAYDNELSTALPAGNDAQAFLGSHQVAVTKLAVEYCDALFEDTALRAQMIPGFNFAATPSTAFNAASKALVTQSLLDRFMGPSLADRPSNASLQPVAIKLLEDILVGKSTTDVNVTKNSIKGVCIALLASAPVSLF